MTCVYNIGYAKFYSDFDDTSLSYSLESYGIGMSRQHFGTIACTHAVMASMHGVYALLILSGAIWHSTLVFSPWPATNVKNCKSSSDGVTHAKTQTSSSPQLQYLTTSLHGVVDGHGLLGVNGKHFHVILICREIVETALQSIQVIRMSKYLPRFLLSRFYLSLVVVNCWSSLLIYSRRFLQDECRRRFAAFVFDLILGLMTTMGVPIIIISSYVNEYNVDLGGFSFELLSDDEWLAQMLNEAQMVVVMSWSDLATRFFFSVGLILTTNSMKDLLQCPLKRPNQVACNAESDGITDVSRLISNGVQEAAKSNSTTDES
ncbi:unnamed protein product [Phytophthora lilii]|uniref:Unnamed protein product n=1 Tax=Phytophthora lilii TaxID=2077276 RepID=A0A9W6WEI2_9STRA|nr:unnamed protein product [Phytophthora lilii]